jgi:predicted site-specific integrase-resolvase
MVNISNEKFVSRKWLAEHYGVSSNTIINWEKLGKIRPYRVSTRVVRYNLSEVQSDLNLKTENHEAK